MIHEPETLNKWIEEANCELENKPIKRELETVN